MFAKFDPCTRRIYLKANWCRYDYAEVFTPSLYCGWPMWPHWRTKKKYLWLLITIAVRSNIMYWTSSLFLGNGCTCIKCTRHCSNNGHWFINYNSDVQSCTNCGNMGRNDRWHGHCSNANWTPAIKASRLMTHDQANDVIANDIRRRCTCTCRLGVAVDSRQ